MSIKGLGVLCGATLALLSSFGSASAVTITIDAIQNETAAPPASPFTLMSIGTSVTPNSYVGTGNGETFGGWTISGVSANSGIYAGNSSSAASVFGNGNSTTEYLAAIGGGGTVTMTAAQSMTSLNILWGTVDSDSGRNVLLTAGGTTISGLDILTAMDAACNCTLASGDFEAYVTISGLSSFNSVTLSDTSTNSFEFLMAAVPEPSTWAMMILGFFGIGFLAYRRQGTFRIV